MIWTRVLAVALTTLITGSFVISAQDEPPRPEGDKPAEQPDGAAKADQNKAPEGKLKVETTDVKLADKTREKELTLTAVYPEEAGKYPVIFFSHGAGSTGDSGSQLAEYWASHGYVVLLPVHSDVRLGRVEQMLADYDKDKDGKLSKEEVPEQMQGFFDTLDTDADGFLTKEELDVINRMGGRGGNRGGRGGEQPENPEPPKKEGEDEFDMVGDPAEMLLEDPVEPEQPQPRQGRQGRRAPRPQPALDANTGVDRVSDISFILSNAEALVKAVPALKDKLDLEKVAVTGHNAGAYTAQLIGGAGVNVEETVTAEDGTESKKTESRSLLDKRVKAILAFSPAGPDQGGLSKESFKSIKLPAMNITGSEDVTGEGQDAAWKKQAFELSGEGSKYQLFIEGASNNSFTAPRRSFRRGGEEPPTDYTFDWVKTSTLNFLNATLKGDEKAKTWLGSGELKKLTEGKAVIESK
ncbi:MAG: hypothetical protein K8I27_13765 [Planctomycetes bacterium]|nr:hypothetical protein [Planctomycetota bacterium]